MKPPPNFSKIINQKRYSTTDATLLAGDDFWDGHNWERRGRNTFLYKTPRGAYFTVTLTQWQEEHDALTPINQSEAIELYELTLTEHRVPYSEAFPGVKVEDA
jgi:hypothetical protein